MRVNLILVVYLEFSVLLNLEFILRGGAGAILEPIIESGYREEPNVGSEDGGMARIYYKKLLGFKVIAKGKGYRHPRVRVEYYSNGNKTDYLDLK